MPLAIRCLSQSDAVLLAPLRKLIGASRALTGSLAAGLTGQLVVEVLAMQYEGQLVRCSCTCPALPAGRACLIVQTRAANAAAMTVGSRLRVLPPWYSMQLPGMEGMPVLLAYSTVVH